MHCTGDAAGAHLVRVSVRPALSGQAPGHAHLPRRVHSDSVLSGGGTPPLSPDEGKQGDIVGTHRGVIWFYLICLCHSLCSPTCLFIFLSFLFLSFFLIAALTIK